MDIPANLKTAIEEMAKKQSLKSLSEKSAVLSSTYRTSVESSKVRYIPDAETAGAYAAYRMPATFAAVAGALDSIAFSLPDWSPGTLLDVGAGPGTAAWAVAEKWPDIRRIVLYEQETNMIETGRLLAAHASAAALVSAEWRHADIRQADPTLPYDLVIASYVLGEIPPEAHADLVSLLWSMTSGILLIVEPGTPERFGFLRNVRSLLTGRAESHLLAPCPHEGVCPMTAGDWCHFSQRISRISLQRQIKSGELSYEDEKFTYLAVSRQPGIPYEARVLRHPQYGKKFLRFEHCSANGQHTRIVSKGKEPEFYRLARKFSWGDPISELPREPDPG